MTNIVRNISGSSLLFVSIVMSANFCFADAHKSPSHAQPEKKSYFTSMSEKWTKQSRAIWRRLTTRCEDNALLLEHMDRGRSIAVKPVSTHARFDGKLGYRSAVPMFSRIDCEGDLSILLDPKGPEGKIRALSSDVNFLDSGDILYLKGDRGNSAYDIVISGEKLVGQIKSVNLYDRCALSGADLNQSDWFLNSDTTGDIILKGMFDGCTIIQRQSNILDMYWVASANVDVVSKAGVMRLSGQVNRSRFRFSGDSQVLVNQLRAENAWLYASDDAYVELFGSKRLAVFTAGSAQVEAEGVPVLSTQISQGQSMFVIND